MHEWESVGHFTWLKHELKEKAFILMSCGWSAVNLSDSGHEVYIICGRQTGTWLVGGVVVILIKVWEEQQGYYVDFDLIQMSRYFLWKSF